MPDRPVDSALDSALGGDLRPVLELASLAPSVHNTQPWRFIWDGTSLHVFEDPSRGLRVLDPSGRERLLSCGAAVLHARLGLTELGHAAGTALLPDPARPELLAVITVEGRTTATEDEHALALAIPRRTTDRDPYEDRPVPAEVLAALVRAAEVEDCWLRIVGPDGSDDAVELQVLLSQADEGQRHDPGYLEELAAWRRTSDEGVPVSALPTVPPDRRASTWVVRDFDAALPGHTAARPSAAEPPPAEHPTVVVLGSEGDTREDWLRAGQALARVLLTATVAGVATQPLTQVLEVPVLRARMRHALGVVGHPQMLLRIGYGHAGPTTHRRPAEQSTTLESPPSPAP